MKKKIRIDFNQLEIEAEPARGINGDEVPAPFATASSSDLFKELGMSQEEADKHERGINAVLRREEIKLNNKD